MNATELAAGFRKLADEIESEGSTVAGGLLVVCRDDGKGGTTEQRLRWAGSPGSVRAVLAGAYLAMLELASAQLASEQLQAAREQRIVAPGPHLVKN